jgi:F-type H+-transporting ATPase subunit b
MLIDWFTVVAQIVNFLLLVWLLRRFLYRRILASIDARESRIAAQVSGAEAKEKEAQKRLSLYEVKLKDFEQQQESMLAQAKLDAGRQQTEMLERARQDVCELETKWREDLERERSAFLLDLRRRAATQILEITRRAVADLACLDVQECAVRVFLEKIRLIDEDARKNLAQGDVLIRTAFDLPGDTQAELRQALEERLRRPVELRFDRAPGLGLGLELRGNGWRIGWNSESYLDSLEEDLREALEQSTEVKAQAGAA